ncbi:hypothetical protein AGR7C_Cc110486 [Agrobacterium deltaense Zutra 3/1]|uniref:Uncharacterized protein n=1 Tax=Agrobacterium deltaense Zutra 3/1 TaxID=1183427 RepID=A0A1S7P7S0_9HYPH|nr:hypothetical protein AGR7C_Cc110486 [Agrobacterium deltaense Zutra 3/1]
MAGYLDTMTQTRVWFGREPADDHALVASPPLLPAVRRLDSV